MLRFPVPFARWDPIRDLLAIQLRLDRFAPAPNGWVPPVDLRESEDEYVLTAELPGLTREDVEIQLRDGVLTLSGHRPEANGACEQFHRVERGHGSFSRSFQLPAPIDGDQISADLRDGVLIVTCPKSREGARRIQIT
jgi:HSP20 family protein